MSKYRRRLFSPRLVDTARSSTHLRSHVAACLHNESLLDAPLESMSDEDRDKLDWAIIEALEDHSVGFSSLTGYGGYGPFPIDIEGVPGIYRVHAQDFDPSEQFFETIEDAENYIRCEFQPCLAGAQSNDPGTQACPYCGAYHSMCEHLLLIVDMDDGCAEHGALCEAFNERLTQLLERQSGPLVDPRRSESLEEVLKQVESIADKFVDIEWSSGGWAHRFRKFYCDSQKSLSDAIVGFRDG